MNVALHGSSQWCPGVGAMTEWRDIVQIVVNRFNLVRHAHQE